LNVQTWWYQQQTCYMEQYVKLIILAHGGSWTWTCGKPFLYMEHTRKINENRWNNGNIIATGSPCISRNRKWSTNGGFS
jgi:hypothetical protein